MAVAVWAAGSVQLDKADKSVKKNVISYLLTPLTLLTHTHHHTTIQRFTAAPDPV